MFEITYSDGREIWTRRGNWEDLAAEQVQLVDYLQADGARIRLAGFDSYYLAGLLWGGVYDHPGRWPVDGWMYELEPGMPAALVGPSGVIPAGAMVKRGSLIPDELAGRLGLAAGPPAAAA